MSIPSFVSGDIVVVEVPTDSATVESDGLEITRTVKNAWQYCREKVSWNPPRERSHAEEPPGVCSRQEFKDQERE